MRTHHPASEDGFADRLHVPELAVLVDHDADRPVVGQVSPSCDKAGLGATSAMA